MDMVPFSLQHTNDKLKSVVLSIKNLSRILVLRLGLYCISRFAGSKDCNTCRLLLHMLRGLSLSLSLCVCVCVCVCVIVGHDSRTLNRETINRGTIKRGQLIAGQLIAWTHNRSDK